MNHKLAILSDIHGNYEALKAVLEDMDTNNINSAISLGDNIGYGPDPNIVVSTLKINNIPSVAGNHELAILNPEIKKWFNPFARESIDITETILTENARNLLKNYPDFIVSGNIRFVHGAPPDEILTYIFEISPSGLIDIFDKYPERFCFIGHTHLLKIISLNKDKLDTMSDLESFIKFQDTRRYIINSGSVGQPRDGDKKAKYLVFDREELTLEIRSVEYDREKTRSKILAKGFPAVYASML